MTKTLHIALFVLLLIALQQNANSVEWEDCSNFKRPQRNCDTYEYKDEEKKICYCVSYSDYTDDNVNPIEEDDTVDGR